MSPRPLMRRVLVSAALLVPVGAASALAPNGAPAASATAATSAGWTTNAAARSTTVTAGTALSVSITVRSSTTRSGLVYFDVNNGAANVAQGAWDAQTFFAGVSRTFSTTVAIPVTATLGQYTVRTGVFGNGWNGLQHWNNTAAAFTVVARPATTTTVPAPTTTLPPTTTTRPPTPTVPPTTVPPTTVPPTTTTRPPTTTAPPTTVPRTTVPPTTAPPTTAPPTTAPPATAPPAQRFSTLPVGAALPSEADCAARVRRTAEIRAMNAVPNQTRGAAPLPENPRVTGNFTGTTDEIIQWAACKWGIDEDIVRAQIAKESYWRQSSGGDLTTDQNSCHPALRTSAGSTCPESYGLGQVRYPYHTSAMTDAIRSSAFNLDYTYSVWRSCYEGSQTWLNQFERGRDYAAGDVWGCVGLWFAGRWYTPGANDYIAAVQAYLNQRIWTTSSFISWTG